MALQLPEFSASISLEGYKLDPAILSSLAASWVPLMRHSTASQFCQRPTPTESLPRFPRFPTVPFARAFPTVSPLLGAPESLLVSHICYPACYRKLMHRLGCIYGACNNGSIRGKDKNISNVVVMCPTVVEHTLIFRIPGLLQTQFHSCDCIKIRRHEKLYSKRMLKYLYFFFGKNLYRCRGILTKAAAVEVAARNARKVNKRNLSR